MCGLAGFNCSLDIAEGLQDANIKRIFEKGISFNLPRGDDAVGWMASYHKDSPHPDESDGSTGLYTLKYPASGAELLKAGIRPKGKPVAAGIHTRAATLGDPRDNRNNHPIGYGGVYVTHNGKIDNHIKLRAELVEDEEKRKALPDVDSVAVPIYLSQLKNPLLSEDKLDELIKGLDTLHGVYTFHAMWISVRGLSLIVAGPDRPMFFIYNKRAPYCIYGSEQQTANALQSQFVGISKKGQLRGELKEGSALLFLNGELVKYWDFKPYAPTVYNQVSSFNHQPTLNRINDLGGVIEEDASKYHWAVEHDLPLTLESAHEYESEGAGKVYCIVDRFKGHVDERVFDLVQGEKRFSKSRMWEADYLYLWSKTTVPHFFSDTARFFGRFGLECETVYNHAGELKDIYNLAIRQKRKDYPWRIVEQPKPAEEPVVVPATTPESWLKGKLSSNTPIADRTRKNRQPQGWTPLNQKITPIKNQITPIQAYEFTCKDGVTVLFRNKLNPWYVFFHTEACPVHAVSTVEHEEPFNCDWLLDQAWNTLEYIDCLDDMGQIMATMEVEINAIFVPCGANKCKFEPSDRETYMTEFVVEDSNLQKREILVEETCDICGTQRIWKNPVTYPSIVRSKVSV